MIGSLMMRVSVVVLLVGMLAGIVMGIQQDFELAPAHAHFNLIGGVLLFLFGLYYRLVPAAGTTEAGQSAGLAPHRRSGRVSGRSCRCRIGRPAIYGGAGCRVSDRGRGDGAVCGDRVPDLARLSSVPQGSAAVTF